MFKVKVPIIPKTAISILEFDAIEGGLVSNTKQINKAIRYMHQQGGGQVIIPKGMWLTGPIELLSHVDLHLDKDAYVLFTKNREEYPLEVTDYEGQPHLRTRSPIFAKNAINFSITGKGILDGNGELWRPLKQMKVTKKEWNKIISERGEHLISTKEGFISYPTASSLAGALRGEPKDFKNKIAEETEYYDYYRPVMVSLVSCDTVLIDGVTIQNSPAWNVHPLFCTNFTLQNAIIKNADYAQNGDGLDLESCQYCHILDTVFDVGDDGICLKSGKNAEAREIKCPTEYVLIQGCKVYAAHGGFVIGSEMSRGVNHIWVKDCIFMGSDIGIRIKSQLGRGGDVCDIFIENIRMHNIIGEAMLFTMGYLLYTLDHEKPDIVEHTNLDDVPAFYNFHIKNIRCDKANIALKINGLTEKKINDITLEDIAIYTEHGIELKEAYDIKLKDVLIYNDTARMHFIDEIVDDNHIFEF